MDLINTVTKALLTAESYKVLGIESICGIDIDDIIIEKFKCLDGKVMYKLMISADFYHKYNEDDDEVDAVRTLLLNENFISIDELLKYFDNILVNAKIDYKGKLTIEDNTTEQQNFWRKYKDNKNIKLKCDECCVCFEFTKSSTTCCNKKICLKCAQTIEKIALKDIDDDADFPDINCPCCRQEFCLII